MKVGKIRSIKVTSKKRNISSFKELANFGKATPDGVFLPEGFCIRPRIKHIKRITTNCSNVAYEGSIMQISVCKWPIFKKNTVFVEYINIGSDLIIGDANLSGSNGAYFATIDYEGIINNN